MKNLGTVAIQILALIAAAFAALNVADVLTVLGDGTAALIGAGAVLTAGLAQALHAPRPAFPKWMSVLAVLAGVFGALNTAAFLTVIGPAAGGILTVLSVVTAALSRGIRDVDGDGLID